MFNQAELKGFMNDFMRQKLFFSPEFSRYDLCRYFEYHTRCQLDFGEKMDLVKNILELGNSEKIFIESNAVPNTESNELEYVLSFKVDPVNATQWGEFIKLFS